MSIIAILLSLLIFRIDELAGVWQRIMFVIMFAWLMYFLYSRADSFLHYIERKEK